MDFFVNDSHDPAFNLALEELLAAGYGREFFMLWRNAPSIIVGRNQNTAAEIDAAAVRELDLHVVRRITGGGAVYHDLGNQNYTIARDVREFSPSGFAECARPVVSALRRMGVPAGFSGRNDILVAGRKVSGGARSVLRERTLFHGTMLFDVDMSVLERVLKPDAEKIRSKGVKSVRSRVMNLRELFPAWSMEEFQTAFRTALLEELGIASPTPIPPEFLGQAEKLAAERYRSWDWNYGIAYPYEFNRRARFPGGAVEVSARIEKNRIAELSIRGDFFGDAPAEELASSLLGCRLRPEAVAQKLAHVDLGRYMSGVTKEELASLFE